MILNKLAIGQSGRLLRPERETAELMRLQELGFVEGALVRLVRRGPLGSPLLFDICQTQIAIRKDEAEHFQVE
ncbi:MAG: FeoA family protein [Myxococcaceae bacterium]